MCLDSFLSWKLTSREHVMSTFLSVQGMHHVHFPLSTGHVSSPLTVQGTAILHSLSWLMCIYLSNDDSWVFWDVRVCEWFPACQRIAVPSYSMAGPLKLEPVTKHSITSHNTHILRDSPVRTSNLSDGDILHFITLLSPHALSLPTHCHSVMLKVRT